MSYPNHRLIFTVIFDLYHGLEVAELDVESSDFFW